MNILKKYSLEDAEIIPKSYSAKKIFENHLGGLGNVVREEASGVDRSIMNQLGK